MQHNDVPASYKPLNHEDSLNEFGIAADVGGSAGNGTHGGYRVKRPDDMPTKDDCDVVVSTAGELITAVQKDDITIYLDENAGKILFKGPRDIPMGNGVTIVGQYCDPNYPGRGTFIKQDYYHRNLFISAYGDPPTFWGVPLIGPMLAADDLHGRQLMEEEVYFDPRSDERTNDGKLQPEAWYASGLHTYDTDSDFLFHGCEFAGWSVAALEIGAKGYQTDGDIIRCSFHDNLMETLGYGVEAYNGHQWYDRCFGDRNRHWISGYGYATQSYELTESFGGDGETAGHHVDMHETTAEENTGGHHVKIRNCSFASMTDLTGSDQEAYAQRGVPVGEDELWNNCFVHPTEPNEPGSQGDAYRQETPEQRDEWEHFSPYDNIFGRVTHPDYGAPLEGEEAYAVVETKPLTLIGEGGTTYYEITIAGNAFRKHAADDGEVINNDNGTATVAGSIGPYRDTFAVSEDASIKELLIDGPVTIKLDGDTINKTDYIGAWIWNHVKEDNQ